MSAAFLDLAKSVFQVHGVDAQGKVVVTKRLRWDAVLAFFANLAPCVVWDGGVCRITFLILLVTPP